MKPKLAAALLALSSLPVLAHAESPAPLPSFQDNAAIEGAAHGNPAIQREFPKPSFADGAPVVAERVVTNPAVRSSAETLALFPQPSSSAN
jgi:hypothetical protein